MGGDRKVVWAMRAVRAVRGRHGGGRETVRKETSQDIAGADTPSGVGGH